MNEERNRGVQSIDDTFTNWRTDCLLVSPLMSHGFQFFYCLIMSLLWAVAISCAAIFVSWAFGPKTEAIVSALVTWLLWPIVTIALLTTRYKPTRYVMTGAGYKITLDLNGWQIGGWRTTRPENGWMQWMWWLIRPLLLIVKRGIVFTPGDHGAFGFMTYWKTALGGPTISAECPDLSVIDDESTIPNARVTVEAQDGGTPEISGAWTDMNPWQLIRRATQYPKLSDGLDAVWDDVVNVSTSFLRQAFTDITVTQIKQSKSLDADLRRALLGVQGDDQDQRVRKVIISGNEQTILDMENGLVLYNLHINDVFLPKGMREAMDEQGKLRYQAQGRAAAMQITEDALKDMSPDLREDVMIAEGILSGEEVSVRRNDLNIGLKGLTGDQAIEVSKNLAQAAPAVAAALAGRGEAKDGKKHHRKNRRGGNRPPERSQG